MNPMDMHIFKAIRETLIVPIHPAAWPLVALFVLVGLVLTLIWEVLFFPSCVLVLWCIYFFRNPKRTTPLRDGLIIAPADGRIIGVEEIAPTDEMDLPRDKKYIRIAIFMNVFDVHVNRAPMAGVITDRAYFPGQFFAANLDKSAAENERLGIVIEHASGRKIGAVQIAGAVARRIVCDVGEADVVEAGAAYGIVRFGSRVDVWLPKPVRVAVLTGQRTIAGETILADYGKGAASLKDDEKAVR